VPSDFFGLSVGLSALNVARREMEVAAQNVSNANTDGYSRQRVEIATIGNPAIAGITTRTDGAGSGVAVVGTFRTVDDFLQARSLVEHATNAQLTRSKALLDRVELTFNEPSDTGLQSQLADLWAGFEDVANNPGDLASRSQLVQRGITVATTINQAGSDLDNLWKSSVEQLQTIVTGANATAKSVADLNGAIKQAMAAGLSPNSLLDQRDKLAQTLAEQVGGVVRPSTLGQVDVFVGGTAIVRGEDAEALYVDNVTNNPNIVNAQTNPVQVRWAKDTFPATIASGEAGALLDGLNRMLPSYRAALLGPGATPASVAEPGAGVTLASLTTDFSAAPLTFQVSLDGAAPVNVTLNTDLAGGATASNVQSALNTALGAAGLSGVVAKVRANAGNLAVSFESVNAGASETLGVTGANPPLFSGAPTTVNGAGPGATPATVTGPAILPSAASVDWSTAANHQFDLSVNGNPPVTISLNTDLSGGATSSTLQAALQSSLAAAGITNVTANVATSAAGNLVVSLLSTAVGPGQSLAVSATGGDTTAATLFGATPTTAPGTAGSATVPGLAAQISQAVNARHNQGIDLNGNAGQDFFTFSVVNGLTLNITSPSEVAASGAGKPGLDAGNALDLADIGNVTNGPDNTYRNLIIGLGVETQTSNRRVEIQSDITKQVDAAKDSAAGVNIDDEMANMIAYQHTYGAASRVITAIDEMLDRLINNTGMVGR